MPALINKCLCLPCPLGHGITISKEKVRLFTYLPANTFISHSYDDDKTVKHYMLYTYVTEVPCELQVYMKCQQQVHKLSILLRCYSMILHPCTVHVPCEVYVTNS